MKTIVIVDDEFGFADVLSATLSDVGFRVHVGANGVQGLVLICEHVPDLALLDYLMPLLDGPGVLQAMRANERLAHIPVLIMSALPKVAVQPRCSDCICFLRKPFPFDAMLGAVERAIGPAGRVRHSPVSLPPTPPRAVS